MSVVTLAKAGDGVREDFPGVGELGSGPVRFMGRIPVRNAGGPLILVSGMRVRVTSSLPGPFRVRAVAVAIRPDGHRDRAETVPSYRGVVITSEGHEYPTGPRGTMESVRLEWLRLAVESGTFSRVARMS